MNNTTNDSICDLMAENGNLKVQNMELMRALESIPTNCDHQYPHLLACWHCIVKDAIAKHGNLATK